MSDAPSGDTPRTPATFEPGAVVAERYEILEVIGQGSTGVVYRARDLHVDSEHEIVALKAIHQHLHSDRQIFGRFRREVKILRTVTGPHLCKLLDCVEEQGLLLIALEYVDGPSLDAYLAEHAPLPLAEIVVLLTQICQALMAAHAAGVVHRDLKPSNVLIEGVRPGGRRAKRMPQSFLRELSVRVVDFGLAKMVRGEAASTMLTERDMIFGTPDYMAPEQVTGEELDARCDVYAAGVIAFQMIVGTLPFDAPTPLTTMAAHLNSPVPRPSSLAPDRDIGKSMDRVLLKALAKDKAERYATPEELASAVAEAAVAGADVEPEQGVADEDTARIEGAQMALSTTLPSHPVTSASGKVKRGGKVQVVVKDAVSSLPPPPRARRANVEETIVTQTSEGERRMWIVVALVVSLAALVLGFIVGSR